VTRQGEDPLRTLFKGSIAAEDMECGTMREREGLPWGVDLDWLRGLLYGSLLVRTKSI